MDTILVVLAIPVFLAFMALEYALARRRHRVVYRFADSVANLGNGIGMQILAAFFVPVTVGGYAWVYKHWHVGTISPRSPLAWIVLFFAVDLAYYVFHRASHRINFLWAMHVVHHQSEEYNYSVALRQSWLDQLLQWLFYVPLAIAGFPTLMYLTMSTLNTLYQFFIHTRLVGKLGPLERVLNTPSHHRVHHGVNPRYVDRNYGGILIVWDRLFGSFEPEGDEPVYGIVKPLGRYNPLWANVHYYVEMARLAAAGRGLERLRAWVAPPEWRPRALGGSIVVPEPTRTGPSLLAPRDRGADVFIGVQLAIVLGATSYFIYVAGGRGLTAVIGLGAAIMAMIVSWGVLHDRRVLRATA
jgi:sterol desaturase/sphingolipid hydroxylase (fatty acid hydroxylase superfamily)